MKKFISLVSICMMVMGLVVCETDGVQAVLDCGCTHLFSSGVGALGEFARVHMQIDLEAHDVGFSFYRGATLRNCRRPIVDQAS